MIVIGSGYQNPFIIFLNMEASSNKASFWGGSYNGDYSIWGPITDVFWKLSFDVDTL